MKKTIAMHEEKDNKTKSKDGVPKNAVPAYLLEREQVDSNSLVLGWQVLPLIGFRNLLDT